MDKQRTFFDDEFTDDMEAKRHARRSDPSNSHQAAADIVISGKMWRQCEIILHRLQQGPASSADLAALTLKYTSRISDLRKAGHHIQCQHNSSGHWVYFLYDKE